MAEHDSADFDDWYREVIASPTRDRLVNQWLGLPPDLPSTGYLTGEGLEQVVAALDVGTDEVLVELGCGRGGYGLAAARSSGASLVGVDFAPVAIASARVEAERLGMGARARFVVGDLAATGLPDETADAVLCVDSIHFASSVPAVGAELRRILVPGGRAVLTTWQGAQPDDASLPERVRRMSIERDLQQAGLSDIRVTDQPSWQAVEVAYWTAACQLDPSDDPAVQGLKDEAELFLPLAPAIRRFLVTAVAPR